MEGWGVGTNVSFKIGSIEETGVGGGNHLFMSLKKVSWIDNFDWMSKVCMSRWCKWDFISEFCCCSLPTLSEIIVILCASVVPSPCICLAMSSAWCARIFTDSCINSSGEVACMSWFCGHLCSCSWSLYSHSLFYHCLCGYDWRMCCRSRSLSSKLMFVCRWSLYYHLVIRVFCCMKCNGQQFVANELLPVFWL